MDVDVLKRNCIVPLNPKSRESEEVNCRQPEAVKNEVTMPSENDTMELLLFRQANDHHDQDEIVYDDDSELLLFPLCPVFLYITADVSLHAFEGTHLGGGSPSTASSSSLPSCVSSTAPGRPGFASPSTTLSTSSLENLDNEDKAGSKRYLSSHPMQQIQRSSCVSEANTHLTLGTFCVQHIEKLKLTP